MAGCGIGRLPSAAGLFGRHQLKIFAGIGGDVNQQNVYGGVHAPVGEICRPGRAGSALRFREHARSPPLCRTGGGPCGWRRARNPAPDGSVDAAAHRQALDLRSALRSFLELPPAERGNIAAARRLTAASRDFPLTLTVAGEGTVTLAAAPGSNALGRVVAELYGLAKTDRLARLKACASEQCHWIFFDRSKPANRHWCSSNVCGNRQKTRDYRRRRTLGCT